MKALIIALAFGFLSVIAMGEENSSPNCKAIESSNDVLKCALVNHAEIQLSNADLEESKLAVDVAAQMTNPEFEAEAIDNKDGTYTSELNLLHTFELGGKRSARTEVAAAEKGTVETALLKTKENVIIQTVFDLFRLRQIEHEVEIVKENLFTFVKVTKQYKRLGRLNPDQNFSISIFKIASEENNLRLNKLRSEKNQILSRLRLATGHEFLDTKKITPKRNINWPKLANSELKGSDVKELKANIELAKTKYNLEKSDSWPDLSIGPKFEHTNGSNGESKIGLTLSLPLPLYQANGAGRAKALAAIRKSELKLKLETKKLKYLRETLLNTYNANSSAIRNSRKNSGIANRHKKLHKLLDRGVVPSSLIIELHSEILEFYERLHEQEISAILAQWKIYALDGTIFEEKIR